MFDTARSILIGRGLFPQDIAAVWEKLKAQAADAAGETWSPTPDDYCCVAKGMWLSSAETCGEKLRAAGIPFHLVDRRGYGVECYVPQDRGVAAQVVLVEAGLIPRLQIRATPSRRTAIGRVSAAVL